MSAPGTSQKGNALFCFTSINAQMPGYFLYCLLAGNSALRGLHLLANQGMSKSMTACLPAGPAIGRGQKLLHLMDARIFINPQKPVGQGQNARQYHPQHRHENDCTCHKRKISQLHGSYPYILIAKMALFKGFVKAYGTSLFTKTLFDNSIISIHTIG
jgi:hypothetical protein